MGANMAECIGLLYGNADLHQMVEMIGILADIILILIVLVGLVIAVMHLYPSDYTGNEEEK